MGIGPLPFNPATYTGAYTGSTLTLTGTGTQITFNYDGSHRNSLTTNSSGAIVFNQQDAFDFQVCYQNTVFIRANSNVFSYIGSGVAFQTDTSSDFTAGRGRFLVSGVVGSSDCGLSCGGAAATVGMTVAGTDRMVWTAGLVSATVPIKTLVTVVASLPSAATAGVGARAFVTDGSTTVILGLGLTVTGGGANKVPVYSDGTNWIVGG